MILSNNHIMTYLGACESKASKFKKEVLNHLGKQTTKITLADLAAYEHLTIEEAKEMLKIKK